MSKFKVGDRVVKNPDGWELSDFDAWGAGEGVGIVVEVIEEPFGVPMLDGIDVRWPVGLAYHKESGLRFADLRYRCDECGWVGTEGQMGADSLVNSDGYCHTICPKCGTWQDLEDYVVETC